MALINDLEIQTYGIRRSGNHAVISWIFNNLNGVTVHLNDIKKHDPNPYKSFSQVKVKGMKFWDCKPKFSSLLRHKLTRRSSMEFVVVDPRLNVEHIRNYSPKECLILSYEDYELKHKNLSLFSKKHDDYVGGSRKTSKILILRDPYNLFASLLKAGFMHEGNHSRFVDLFKEYAHTYIEMMKCSDNIFICVNYNQWCVDENYRIQLAQKIGFLTDGSQHFFVSNKGGGSSFDGVRMSEQTLKSNANLQRWRHFVEDSFYRYLLQDTELRRLSDEIFGSVVDSGLI